jgi:ankyrin repeat protein
VVKLMVAEEGVDANPKSRKERTPLPYAAEAGHRAIVKLLLDKKYIYANSKSRYGQTPLSWVAHNRHKAAADLLRSYSGLSL